MTIVLNDIEDAVLPFEGVDTATVAKQLRGMDGGKLDELINITDNAATVNRMARIERGRRTEKLKTGPSEFITPGVTNSESKKRSEERKVAEWYDQTPEDETRKAVEENGWKKLVGIARQAIKQENSEAAPLTDEEKELGKRIANGETVVVNLSKHSRLIARVAKSGQYERIDRGSKWGNPFVLNEDGNREEVIEAYREFYLPHKPSLLSALPSLKGKALGCWCAPLPCHGDVLAKEA